MIQKIGVLALWCDMEWQRQAIVFGSLFFGRLFLGILFDNHADTLFNQ